MLLMLLDVELKLIHLEFFEQIELLLFFLGAFLYLKSFLV